MSNSNNEVQMDKANVMFINRKFAVAKSLVTGEVCLWQWDSKKQEFSCNAHVKSLTLRVLDQWADLAGEWRSSVRFLLQNHLLVRDIAAKRAAKAVETVSMAEAVQQPAKKKRSVRASKKLTEAVTTVGADWAHGSHKLGDIKTAGRMESSIKDDGAPF